MASSSSPSQYDKADWRVKAGDTKTIFLAAPISAGHYAAIYRITNNGKGSVEVRTYAGHNVTLDLNTSVDVSGQDISVHNPSEGDAKGTYQVICCSFAPIVFPPIASGKNPGADVAASTAVAADDI